MDKVSIVIPIYNVEKYLKKCIDSIINQTYENLEIILVDDESPDNCPKICDDYKTIDSRIKVIHQKNQGLSGARNTGLKEATGKYIMFQDSDDTLENNSIEKLYQAIKEYNAKIVIGGRYYDFEDGSVVCKYKERFTKKYNFEEAIEEMNRFYYYDMSACGKMFEKELFHNIEFPIGKLCEDYFIMYKLFEKAQFVIFVSDPMYHYLQRQNSISKNKKINTYMIDAAYEQMIALENYSETMKEIVHVAYASAFLTVIDNYIKQKVKPTKMVIKEYREKIKENIQYINHYKKISFTKRIQFKLFLLNYQIYKISFLIYRKLKKI